MVELARLQELMTRPHRGLVTLTGPGSVGMTRLALEEAAAATADCAALLADLAHRLGPAVCAAAVAAGRTLTRDAVLAEAQAIRPGA